jgi:hypothetical protein
LAVDYSTVSENVLATDRWWVSLALTPSGPNETPDTAAQQCAAYAASDYPLDENGSKTHDFVISDYSGNWICSTDVRSTTSEDCTTANAGALYSYVP